MTNLIVFPAGRGGDLAIPNSVIRIDDGAFYGAYISHVSIPNSVTSIGSCAFSYSSIGEISIPDSMISIGGEAFSYSSLRTIDFGNSVNNIGEYAFVCCSLSHVNLPNSVTTIGNGAFYFCEYLKEIVVGSSIINIGEWAFEDCPNITSFYCYAERVPNLGSNVFRNSHIEKATLYVPAQSITDYKIADQWCEFGTIRTLEDGSEPEPEPEPEPCATPTISYEDGEILFSCETDGVEYFSEIKDVDVKKHYDSKISLTATYEISVYATKPGMENSSVAKATLCWLQGELKHSDSITPVPNIPVLISTSDDGIQLSGLMGVDHVEFYSLTGEYLGAEPVISGVATFQTTQAFLLVKIGETTVKVKR